MTAHTIYARLGLSRNPFPPTPDAESYFFTPRLEEDFAEIAHCIEARKGFVLLTGEVGLGKSTLVRRLLNTLQTKNCHSALVLNTFLQEGALLSAIQMDFGLPPNDSLEQGLAQLTQFLIARHQAGDISLLVIDDAQNLSVPSLELVRLLCNLETNQEKLLQILLAGQPELEQTLARPELRQLKSRIVKHARLSGLQKNELARYFDFRVNAAHGEGRLTMEPAAAELLHRNTDGNLRQIHLILDRCLYGLATARDSVVTLEWIRRASAELPSLTEKVAACAPSQRKAWLVAGLLAGTAAAAAVVAGGIALAPSPSPAQANSMALAATTAPAATAAAAAPAFTPALMLTSTLTTTSDLAVIPTQNSVMPAAKNTASPLFPSDPPLSSACQKQLETAATTNDVLHVQRLSQDRAAQWTARSSLRACRFDIDNQPWLAWLGRSEVRHITAAQQATHAVQAQLKQLGLLDRGEPDDGLFGPKTQQAFARFQQQQGLAATGKPDDLTFFLLEHQDVPVR